MSPLSSLPLKSMDPAALTMAIIETVNRRMPHDSDRVQAALAAATFLHRNQVRGNRAKFARTPYIEHPLRVALRLLRWGVTDAGVIIAAILHDTLEDCEADILEHFVAIEHQYLNESEKTLAARCWMGELFGLEVLSTVVAVTNDPSPAGASREQKNRLYVDHVRHTIHGNAAAFLVKFADYMDNGAGLHHNNVPGNTGMVQRLAAKYSPLADIFEAELLDNPGISALVSVTGLEEIVVKIASSRETLRQLNTAA